MVGVYRRLITAKKMQAVILSTRFFCGTGFYKRQEKKLQRGEKNKFRMVFEENWKAKNQ